MKKVLFVLISFFMTAATLSAKNINFEVVQNTPGQEDVFDISQTFEAALADFFFESGHIVSNCPVFILGDEASDKADLKRALVDTMLGSMDYLVRIQVNYIPEKAQNPKALLLECIKDVSWKNYSSKTGKLLSSGSAVPDPVDDKNNNESGVYNFASDVAAKISSGLKNKQ